METRQLFDPDTHEPVAQPQDAFVEGERVRVIGLDGSDGKAGDAMNGKCGTIEHYHYGECRWYVRSDLNHNLKAIMEENLIRMIPGTEYAAGEQVVLFGLAKEEFNDTF